ncbi:MAG: esterase-like activity of phytase family protein [Scytolyngbya sp. HA4215-MV1]|nr:esterase-like activity of phytase family protein [Scytolyngbya sp. HA4215-MV1]
MRSANATTIQTTTIMFKKSLSLFLLTSLITAPAAYANPQLIAIGKLDGNTQDLANQTSAALESGVPGNILGGLGSGLAYAGCNAFIATPDRGPNATPYNSAVDDTTSYINRFQVLNLRLVPSQPGAALPFTLASSLTGTTPLFSRTPLYYGTGAGLGLGSGKPALNTQTRSYFVGRSDNFDPTQSSTNPNNGRFDPEGVRVANDGGSVFISDEYGPYIYQFNRDGRRIRTFTLPAKFAISNLSPVGNTEINGNTSGRVANKGMEGLAITPDGKTLFGVMQSPLIQDGGTNAPDIRIVKIDIKTGATQEYAYELDNIGTVAKPKYGIVSEIVAINEHEFLVDERDGKGLGDNSVALFKKLYRIDLTGAPEVSSISGAANLVGKTVSKTLFLDLVTALNANGISSTNIPAKIEGIAFGPDVVINGVTKHTLFIANDNDFIGTVTDTNHPTGFPNPNQFFVFAIDKADLPGFASQQIYLNNQCKSERDGH